MRGEYCVAGASVLSALAVIMLVFVNIGQVSSGAVTNGLYFVEMNTVSFGAGLQGAIGSSVGGLYDSQPRDPMGKSTGIRQYYRYGLYNACGYQTSGAGICNSTIIGYPFEPLTQLVSDVPAKFKVQAAAVIPDSTFKDNGYNHSLSRAANFLIFIGSILALVALVFGFIKARIGFFVAAATSGVSALFLMIGAAMWTALISKDNWIKIVQVKNKASLGITVNAGPSLYLTWVSFGLIALSILPYVIACCTFRRN